MADPRFICQRPQCKQEDRLYSIEDRLASGHADFVSIGNDIKTIFGTLGEIKGKVSAWRTLIDVGAAVAAAVITANILKGAGIG